MTEKGVHNAEDMYKFFKTKHPNSDVNKRQYINVVELFFKAARDEILEGKTFKLGQRLGSIRILKVKRTYRRPRINIVETLKLYRQGIKKNVYFTDEYWYRWYWNKKSCQVTNKTVYCFQPTIGANGNTKKLSQKLQNEEFSYLLYKS
jgi:hypothetical protein